MRRVKSSRRQFLGSMAGSAGLACAGLAWGPGKAWADLDGPAGIEAGPDSWPLFRGNPSSTGEAASSLPENPTTVWKFTVKDGGFEATPAVAQGTCYIGDLDGTLYAIDLQTGLERWRKKTGALGFAGSVALSGERLYVGDIDGKFYCFDLQGNEQWQFAASAEISASANFHKRNVLFGSQDTTLYCLNAGSGQLVWKHAIDDQIRCCPTVVQDRAFVAGCDGRLHIIDLDAGQGIATVDIHAPTGVTPAVRGKHVYFGTEGGIVFCVDWQQAKVVWTFEDDRGREIRSSPAVNDQTLVIGSRSKSVYGIDLLTGKLVWTFPCKRAVDSSPVIVGSRVVVGASDGRLYALDMKTGEPQWLMETGGGYTGSPAVVANRLLIANDDGVLYCFG